MSLDDAITIFDDLIRDELTNLRQKRFFIDNNNEITTDATKGVIDLKHFLLEAGYEFYCCDEYGDSIQVDPLIIGNDEEMKKIENMQKIRQTCLEFFKTNGGIDFIKNNNLYYYKDTNTIEKERIAVPRDNNCSRTIGSESDEKNIEETKIETDEIQMGIEIKELLFETGIILVIEEEWIDFKPTLPNAKHTLTTSSNEDNNAPASNNILTKIKSLFSFLCVISKNDKYFESELSKNVFVNSLGIVTLEPEDDNGKNESFAECIKKLSPTLEISDPNFHKRESLIDQFVVMKR